MTGTLRQPVKLSVNSRNENHQMTSFLPFRLSRRVKLAKMMPHEELASTKYCLADPETAYLVYVPQGVEAGIDLSRAKAKLTAVWLDCTTGKSQPAESVEGGQKRKFKSPLAGYSILCLRRMG